MKTQPRYTKESLRQQLVLAANRIIAQAYAIEPLAPDEVNIRVRTHFLNCGGGSLTSIDPVIYSPTRWQRIKRWFA